MSDSTCSDSGHTGRKTLLALAIVFLVLGMVLGGIFMKDRSIGNPETDLDVGTYNIVAVVEKGSDSVLLILRNIEDPDAEPDFYRIDRDKTLNFADCCEVGGQVEKVDNGTTYIEFLGVADTR